MYKKKVILVLLVVAFIVSIFLISYFNIYNYVSNFVTFILGIVSIFVYRYFNRAIVKAELDRIDKLIKVININEYKELNFLNAEICKSETAVPKLVDFIKIQDILHNLEEEIKTISNLIASYNEELKIIESISNEEKRKQKEKEKEIITDKINKLNNRKSFLYEKIPIAEKKIRNLRDILSCFKITVTLTNRGYTNIAIRKHALLRVYSNNTTYIDIKMKMSNFEKCELKAQSTIVMIFESSEIQSFLSEDRNFINNFWNQNINARLFFEDINGVVYFSNEIPFANELYPKAIYDNLSTKATKMM